MLTAKYVGTCKTHSAVMPTDCKEYTRSETDNARPQRIAADGDEIRKYGVLLKCPYGLHDAVLLNKIYEELENKYDRKSLWADLRALKDKRLKEMGQTTYEEGYQDPSNFLNISNINKPRCSSKKPNQESFVHGIVPCSKGWSYPEPQSLPMFAWDPQFHGQARKSLRQWIKDEALVIDKRCADSMSACDICKRVEASKKWHPARIPRPFDGVSEPNPSDCLCEYAENASKDDDQEISVEHWVSSNYPRTDEVHAPPSTSAPPEDYVSSEMNADDQLQSDVKTLASDEDSDSHEASKSNQYPEEPAQENKDCRALAQEQLNRNNSHVVSRPCTPSLRVTPANCDVNELKFPEFGEMLANKIIPKCILGNLEFQEFNSKENVSACSLSVLRRDLREVHSNDTSHLEHNFCKSVASCKTKKKNDIKSKTNALITSTLERSKHKFNDSLAPNSLKVSDMTRALFGGDFPIPQAGDPSGAIEKEIDSLRSVVLFSTSRIRDRVGSKARKSYWVRNSDTSVGQQLESLVSDRNFRSRVKLPTLPEYRAGNSRHRLKHTASQEEEVLTTQPLARGGTDQVVHTIPLHLQTLIPQVKENVFTPSMQHAGHTHFILSSSRVKTPRKESGRQNHKPNCYQHVHKCLVPDIIRPAFNDSSDRGAQKDFGSLCHTLTLLNKFQ